MRYFITLSYLGTRYKGWQLQPNAPSVQATIEEALQTLLRREVPLTGCGRTDTGVHARFYVAHFDSEKPLPARFVAGMNGLLPPDIAIHSFREVAPDAHARFDAYERSYEYHIGFRKDPFSTETALFYPQYHRLDIEKMQEAAATLLEYDAFFPFCKTHSGVDHYEDAQSMVFDTSNLFERDKFSGFDRVEGGTRANVGFRYAMAFTGGASINFMAGQSYHLAGQNSFAKRDLVNAGLESGLETDKSDYVASVDLNTGAGITVGLDGRFDEKSLNMRRGEANLRYVDPVFAGSASYIFIASQPNYGLDEDRHEIRGSGSVKVSEYVRLFGSAAFDIQNSSLFSHSYGVAYDDSCFSLSATYSESDNRYDGETVERSVMFRLGLRTIGETEYKRVLEDNTTN